MSKVCDIESNNTKGIEDSLGRNARSGIFDSLDKTDICVRTIVIIILALFTLPFGITSVYYAFTDNSCVNLPAGKLYVNLKDYLAVNGCIYLLVFCVNATTVGIAENRASDVYQTILYKTLKYLCALFTLSWNIVGGIIFWSLIDNDKCDGPIYNYVYALMIIQFVFTSATILKEKDVQ